ncbi:unnamed protein product, partial [Prorocentrum cordatum]
VGDLPPGVPPRPARRRGPGGAPRERESAGAAAEPARQTQGAAAVPAVHDGFPGPRDHVRGLQGLPARRVRLVAAAHDHGCDPRRLCRGPLRWPSRDSGFAWCMLPASRQTWLEFVAP